MPETVEESWVLASGLRDDMVISIYSAYFATDAEYQGGRQYLLHLIGLDEKNESVTLKMSVGADWESADGGNTITHPTKVKQRINASTIYGHWISNAQEIPELVAELLRRGSPTNAKVWEGLIIHAIEKEIKFGKNIEPQMRLMPSEYFGLIQEPAPGNVQAQPPAQPVLASQPIPTAPVAPVIQPAFPPVQAPQPVMAPQPVQPPQAPVDPNAMLAQARAAAAAAANAAPVNPLYQQYWDLARATDDWGTFLATALADANVLADEELAQQIINQGLLYTQARS